MVTIYFMNRYNLSKERMKIGNKEIQERDDMIYGRKPYDEKRVKEINEAIRKYVIPVRND